MKKAFLVFMPLLLTACVPVQRAAQVPQLKGSRLSAVVSRLGAPQQEIWQGGLEEVYIWTHDETWQTYMPDQGPNVGVIGKNVVYGDRTSYASPKTYTWECRFSVSTDNGRITGARYWGDPPACQYFKDRMAP